MKKDREEIERTLDQVNAAAKHTVISAITFIVTLTGNVLFFIKFSFVLTYVATAYMFLSFCLLISSAISLDEVNSNLGDSKNDNIES
ncbi:hypothetical protein [Enterococcus sp. BWR-S5]|uniref:hypothetical protein n=1 Tax=Enterococcus sp. BWR-S5 TaxID=2787714 RepID=UPI0019236C2C|nr:hypothetical protein [Enterococcus sp. BWR-S5]MBL1227270.1 hypothetical protein [Enterococcus sp. BWR-S5]